LHANINHGFAGVMEDVPWDEFRRRVSEAEQPDLVPVNFFLFNKKVNGVDHLIADEESVKSA
jgi:hypothetical protein